MTTKIVVVDDSRVARAQVAGILRDAGYEVVEAVDGQDGLLQIGANPDSALIICDVNMPNMGGLDMLAAVKASPASSAIPIVMLTTEAQPQLIQQAKASGALGWLIKPVKRDMLVAAVRKLTAKTPLAKSA